MIKPYFISHYTIKIFYQFICFFIFQSLYLSCRPINTLSYEKVFHNKIAFACNFSSNHNRILYKRYGRHRTRNPRHSANKGDSYPDFRLGQCRMDARSRRSERHSFPVERSRQHLLHLWHGHYERPLSQRRLGVTLQHLRCNASGPLVNPYFVLYNKYRGILRIYLYLTTEFVATSSYLQDGISVVSDHQTSLLSFLGKEIIDPEERYATTDYIQIQGSPDNISPMAANKWYMMQYELAYDPDITSIPYDQVQLAWYLNYCNVQTIKLGGTQEGRINGTIGAASSTTFYDEFKTAAKSTGTAVLTGIGKNFITENARDETTDSLGRNNNLGLPNYIYSSISNTINSALSGSLDEIPQALFKGFNAIFGLNKTTQPIPINLTFKSQIELNGDLSDRGSFPSSPSSFWLPGTDIASDAVGYIPLYNKPLGVLGLDGRPKVSPMVIYQRVSDGYKLFVTYKTNTFRQRLQYNPEVEAIADIQLTKLELIETDFQGRFTQVCPNRFFAGTLDTNYNPTSSIDVPEYLAFRATFKITPNNGDEPTVIIKTFKTDQDPLPLKNAQ